MSDEQREAMLAKERQVLELRTTGMSFYQINRQLNIKDAHATFKRAIGRDTNTEFRRAEAIRLEEARLDAAQEGIWPKVLAGDSRAVEVALKVMERRARMLGLDFADLVSSRLVEIEASKVELCARALAEALRELGVPADQQRAGVSLFLNKIREVSPRTFEHNTVHAPDGEVWDAEIVLDDRDAALL